MLSAVAARKARLTQSQSQSPPTPAPVHSTSESSPPPYLSKSPSPSGQKPLSKRKSSAPAGNVPKKQKSDPRKPTGQPARYFAQPDAFKTQDDLIVVDHSDNQSSSSSHDSDFEDAAPAPVKTGRIAKQKRAWSPSAPAPDSSDEDADEDDEHVILHVPIPPASEPVIEPPSVLSSFRPVLNKNVFRLPLSQVSVNDFSSTKGTILLLSAHETVALLGTYTLTIHSGSVSLYGATLSASQSSYRVYAPRSSPIPLIQCLTSQSASKHPLPSSLPSHTVEAAKGYDAVVEVQELHTGIEGLGRICRTFDGFFAPSRWHRSHARFDLGLDTVYFLGEHTSDVSPLVVPKSWDTALAKAMPVKASSDELIAKGTTYLVRGTKNAGKSTLARILVNRLLSRYRRVAYLECDLGQSEFTPGGMVSLNIVEQPVLGPPFSHPSVPFSSHFIGATSPRNCPSHYLDSIQALVQLYTLDVQNASLDDEEPSNSTDNVISSVIPLVVNTMGWTKGLGADLGRKVEAIVEPSHVFSFETSFSEDEWNPAGPSYSQELPGSNGPRVYVLESIPLSPLSAHYTAADHRNLNMLSYLHAVFPDLKPASPYSLPTATSWNTSLPLCAQPPYEVDCQAAFDKLILAGAGMEDVVPSEVHRALNGAIVALVSCDSGTLDHNIDPMGAEEGLVDSSLPYEQGALPPSPHTSRCLGLALVRGLSRTHLQLLTPTPASLLQSARVLVMGELRLPIWGMLDFRTLDDGGDIAGYERGKVPYLRWGKGEGAGGERRRVRRNLMRRGQM